MAEIDEEIFTDAIVMAAGAGGKFVTNFLNTISLELSATAQSEQQEFIAHFMGDVRVAMDDALVKLQEKMRKDAPALYAKIRGL